MSNYPAHVCLDRQGEPRTDDDGRQVRPDMATCGSCDRSWCYRCHPTPAHLCPWENGDAAGVEYAAAAIPPRQARELARR